jgi:putative ABC transport system permease protein
MFHHLMKLIWKRKGRNLMLSLEILLAFVIVFAVAAFGLRSWQLYSMPIGFVADDVWSVSIHGARDTGEDQQPAIYDQLKRGLLELPAVRQVAFTAFSPYVPSSSWTDFKDSGGGRDVHTELVEASDDFFSLLDVKLAQGRGFDRSDDGAAATPVVINRRLARDMFGDAPALGRQLSPNASSGSKAELLQVVGVVNEFRKRGELDAPSNLLISRHSLRAGRQLNAILIKMAPGTPRAFEETLSRRLKLINPQLSYEISPLSALRASMLSNQLMPILVLSVIAAFLLLMVAFGLFGVLWQNTTRRIPEIGLRRAIGANAGNIYRQIIAEQFLLSSGAMLVALLLLVQLPITGALGDSLNWTVFAAAAALSAGVIYLLSLLCSVYPGWRASRLSPTEALHYE